MSQRNQLSRLAPSISSWSNPWEYSFYYTTQIWQDWQNWGQVWGQPQVTEVSTAAAHENPYIQSAHTAAARINRYGEGAGYNYEIREYNGSWSNWTDMNVYPTEPLFDGKVGIS